MQAEDLNEEMFAGGKILHLTGITPVLSDACEALVMKAVELGKKAGLTISFDPNIRKKLWKDKDYTDVLKRIVENTGILMLGLDEARILYGTTEKEKIIDAFFQNGAAQFIAIKDGSKGAYVADRDGGYAIPPYAGN